MDEKDFEVQDKIEKGFDKIEPMLFSCKYSIFLAVIISVLTSFTLIGYGIYEFYNLVSVTLYQEQGGAKELEVAVLGIVELFLFAMAMIIFAFGSYNLFVSKLDNVKKDSITNKIRPKCLRVDDFSELKTIFIKIVLMILIITFLELIVTSMDLLQENVYSLLIIPVGIMLIALSLNLLHKMDNGVKGIKKDAK